MARIFGGTTRPDPIYVLEKLAEAGVTRVLIEAGVGIAASFFKDDLIDEIHWFRTPSVMGADGLSVIGELGHDIAKALMAFELVASYDLDGDACEVYQRRTSEIGS